MGQPELPSSIASNFAIEYVYRKGFVEAFTQIRVQLMSITQRTMTATAMTTGQKAAEPPITGRSSPSLMLFTTPRPTVPAETMNALHPAFWTFFPLLMPVSTPLTCPSKS